MTGRPTASLSLDLDNLWSYLKVHGDPEWSSLPSYLELVVPRILDFLKERELRLTVFVVGQDAALKAHGRVLRSIADAGHEIGNHSFHHEPWLHTRGMAAVEGELDRAEQAILQATGQRPGGFRGPGFCLGADLLEVLARRGYDYDCSTLPTSVGPLARMYYFLKSDLDAAERRRRGELFGGFRAAFGPLKPYRWQLDAGSLTEVPVTTLPFLRTPIHISYVLYLGTWSERLARFYFDRAMASCRLFDVAPSLLLHPLDFLGCDDVDCLSFFPGMNLEASTKLARLSDHLDSFTRRFEPLPIGEYVEALGDALLPVRLPPAPTSPGEAPAPAPIPSVDAPEDSDGSPVPGPADSLAAPIAERSRR